jgi:hypothetical protein
MARLVQLATRVILDRAERLVLRALREFRATQDPRGRVDTQDLLAYLGQQVIEELLARQVIRATPARQVYVDKLD